MHSTVILAGMLVNTGFVISYILDTVVVCTAGLPQMSAIVNVYTRDWVQPFDVMGPATPVTVPPPPQLSDQVVVSPVGHAGLVQPGRM